VLSGWLPANVARHGGTARSCSSVRRRSPDERRQAEAEDDTEPRRRRDQTVATAALESTDALDARARRVSASPFVLLALIAFAVLAALNGWIDAFAWRALLS
jgi:hypothetical protein